MTCPRCRTETFSPVCPVCATPLTAQFIPIPQEERFPATQLLKEKCRSPLALILAILMTAQLISVICVSAVSVFADGIPAAQTGTVVYCVLSILASLPAALSAWLIYGAAFNRRSPLMKDAGFVILQLFAVVMLVLSCGGALVLLAALLIAFISSLSGNTVGLIELFSPAIRALDETLASFVVFAAIFFGAAVIVFAIVVLAKAVGTLSFLRAIARRGRGKGGVSILCAVGCFIFSAVLVVSAAAYFVTGAYLSGICESLSAALFGVTGAFIVVLRRALAHRDDPFLRADGAYPAPADGAYPASVDGVPTVSAEQANPYVRIERR